MAKGYMAWRERDQNKIHIPDGVRNGGAYKNLMNQLNKMARHNRQGSFETKDRYYEAVDRFARHLADLFNLQKFSNVSGKHLSSYVEYMQEQGLAASTIKTDLSAIRFFHDKCEKVRHLLPDNKALKEEYGVDLERRTFGGVDRTWSEKEFKAMVDHAKTLGRKDISDMIQLARYQGLRLHETVRLDRAGAELALRSGQLTAKGKGGLTRLIPLRVEARSLLERVKDGVGRGEKLFVPEGKGAHEVIHSIQSFIENHRDKFAEEDRESSLTYHGLRHSYAREEYDKRIALGMDEKRARLEVAKLLGHGRDSVTRIYLGK
jgi:integrase/recombinase XerD